MSLLIELIIYLAAVAFFGAAFFGDFGFDAFLVAAFFVPVALGFFGVVAFLTFGLAAFFVVAFFAPAGLAVLALACFGFVVFVALADFGVALDRDLVPLAIVTFFGLAAVVVALLLAAGVAVAADVVVAELFVLAVVVTFLADFVPADFERARFFVPDALLDDEADFFWFS